MADYAVIMGGTALNVGISDHIEVLRNTDTTIETVNTSVTLSEPRYNLAAASCNGYVLAMGGRESLGNTNPYSAAVDIFKATENGIERTVFESSLDVPRGNLAAATCGDYTLAMGGNINNNTYSDTVDVYQSVIEDGEEYVLIREDINLKLSEPRANLGAAACGEYIFAVGGVTGMNELSDAVDVFRVTSTGVVKVNIPLNLSSPRQNVQVASCGNFVLAMGGADSTGKPVNVIDVFEIKQKN